MRRDLSERGMARLLLDKYERSRKAIDADDRRPIAVNMRKFIPEVYHPIDFVEPEAAISQLEQKGIIRVQRDRDSNIPKMLYLQPEKLDECYKIAGYTPKKAKDEAIRNCLEKHRSECQTNARFCAYMDTVLKENQSSRYKEDPRSLDILLSYVALIENNTEEIYVKELSALVGGCTTHTFEESYKRRCVHLLNKYGDYDFVSNPYDILKFKGVLNAPYLVKLRGNGIIYFRNGNSEYIEDIPHGRGISNLDIDAIDRIETGGVLLTIENETVFNTAEYPGALYLFTGGFPGKGELDIIKKVQADTYLHTGDIDAGGFNIFTYLHKESGKPFTPYMMDSETFDRYGDTLIDLTKNDRMRLQKMLDTGSGFSKVIRRMLETGKKLEQENIWRQKRREERQTRDLRSM